LDLFCPNRLGGLVAGGFFDTFPRAPLPSNVLTQGLRGSGPAFVHSGSHEAWV